MADNTIKVRLQSAYKSSADWDTLNPVLKNGEVGYVSSPASMYGWYKIGNGTSTWKQLPYSTYRPLNNGDFDTINVTDETAGDLIVTGAARFLNTIQGTASSASNAAKTTGTLTIKAEAGAMTTPSTTFNGSSNVTATIKVPSHTSHLTNNSGYITSGATVAEAKKTSGTLTITQNGTSKGTFNGSANTTVALTDTVYTHPTDGKAGTFGSSTNQTPAFGGNAIVPWFTTNSAGHVTSAGTANLKIPSTSGLATTSYVNERAANAVHFKGGFAASNADALKTPVKEIGDMYVATAAGTFCSFPLEVGDSIIFSSSVAAGTNPSTTGSDFIGVEKTVSVTNSGPTLAWNTVSTVGTVEGVNLTVKMPANPNVDTKATQTATTAKSFLVGNAGSVTTTSGLNLSTVAYVENGLLYSPQARHANTIYGVSYDRTTGTPIETILKTGIKWVSGSHMPIIHITGYAYGLQSPVEFKIGFYIYGDKIGYCGATNMGSWEPKVYLFKYTRDNVNYVAVGLKGSCYFLQLQADVQDEMGKFANIVTNEANWSWEFLTTEGNIPAVDDGSTCCFVPYKANILNGLRDITINGNDLILNKNGSTSSLTVPFATNADTIDGYHASAFLKLSGGTMTGILTMKADQYTDSYSGALNMNNSDIYNLNSIYTKDASETAGEGIHFYRDSTHVDTLWMNGGDLLFVPNRLLSSGSSSTATKAESEKVARLPKTITTGQLVVTDTTGGLLKTTAASAITVGSASYATNASQLGGSAASTYLQGDDVKAGSGITVSTAAGVATVSADLRTTTKLGAAGATAAATETTKIYAVQMDSNGDLAVKVPWTDTDTKVTAVGNHYTPSSSGTFSPAAGGTTTDISTTTLNIITGLQKDAAGHITGVVSGSIKATNTPNTDEKLKMTPASATKFYPAGGTSQTSAVSTAYFSSAVYIQGTSVVAANFVGTATTASYAANAAQLGGKASSAFVLKAGDTMSGNLAVTNVLGISQNAGTAGGISLYNGTGYVTSYGIAFRVTSNGGKHGYVQGDWATYGYMDGATNRGWILKHTSSGPIFSVDGTGNVVANGSLTVGGSSANNTGCKLQFNSTTKSLDFVFA